VTTVLPFRLEAGDDTQVATWYTRSVSYTLHGILRLDERALVLQWSGTADVVEVKGTATRVSEEAVPVRTLALAIAHVAGATLRGWWRPRVVLRARTLEALAPVPGAQAGAVTLWIARRDRAVAAELISGIEIMLADAALAAAEAPPLPPPDLEP
jgi:hypothetical protein